MALWVWFDGGWIIQWQLRVWNALGFGIIIGWVDTLREVDKLNGMRDRMRYTLSHRAGGVTGGVARNSGVMHSVRCFVNATVSMNSALQSPC